MAQLSNHEWRNVGLGLNNQIARDLSSQIVKQEPFNLGSRDTSRDRGQDEQHRPNATSRPLKEPKYNLWPSSNRLGNSPTTPVSRSATPDFDRDRAYALAAGRSSSAMSDRGLRSMLGSASRSRVKDGVNSRRRKASVPELGPMTTVQEAPMDSPTIPGRPPMHERSASAPAPVYQPPSLFEAMVSRITLPGIEAMKRSDSLRRSPSSAVKRKAPPSSGLSPLVIPNRDGRLGTAIAVEGSRANRLASGDNEQPPEPPPKSPRLEGKASPRPAQPYTPADMVSTNVASGASFDTPMTAPEERSCPKPWSTPTSGRSPTRVQLQQSQNKPEQLSARNGTIMERGRPTVKREGDVGVKRQESTTTKRAPSADEIAFKALPLGMRPGEASSKLPESDLESLQQQAIGQATQFEVLGMKDVDNLSIELRGLDERCEYLRRTHSSLRAGRQGLHARMVTYLTSPRLAQHFSRENILKQEEALAELDASIDEWVTKLEQAENRRTRVRQKLLEHVAGALMTRRPEPLSACICCSPTAGSLAYCSGEHNASAQGSKVAMIRTMRNKEDTPPISPGKTFPSSPSTPPPRSSSSSMTASSATTVPASAVEQQETNRRHEVESIKIYADSNVYSLFSDVEQEIDNIADSWVKGALEM
ncbi:MAG: hypothetical protein M4579_001760 [Chaenotheca gracillima]|nr:MAG: hypothetical protein M4579_001760 [Chaenotheca gracillima]